MHIPKDQKNNKLKTMDCKIIYNGKQLKNKKTSKELLKRTLKEKLKNLK
jgi:hypothetical protein